MSLIETKKFDYVELLLCGIFMTTMVIIFCMLAAESRPIVKISSATGKCVEIEIQGKCFDCSGFKDLTRYEIVFVK